MKKQKIQLIVVAAILLIFICVFLIIKKTDLLEEKIDEVTTYDVVSLDSEEVNSLSYLLDGQKIMLKKTGETWKVEGDNSIELDSDSVSSMAKKASSITSTTLIPDVSDLGEYGLDKPQNTITVTLNDGSSISLLIGDSEDMSGGYYAKAENDSNVYVISSSTKSGIIKDLDSIKVAEESTEE